MSQKQIPTDLVNDIRKWSTIQTDMAIEDILKPKSKEDVIKEFRDHSLDDTLCDLIAENDAAYTFLRDILSGSNREERIAGLNGLAAIIRSQR